MWSSPVESSTRYRGENFVDKPPNEDTWAMAVQSWYFSFKNRKED
jgi:hypothetical protein